MEEEEEEKKQGGRVIRRGMRGERDMCFLTLRCFPLCLQCYFLFLFLGFLFEKVRLLDARD
jgi:hypothetical protein